MANAKSVRQVLPEKTPKIVKSMASRDIPGRQSVRNILDASQESTCPGTSEADGRTHGVLRFRPAYDSILPSLTDSKRPGPP